MNSGGERLGAALLRVIIVEGDPKGRRFEQDWLTLARVDGWEQELLNAAARAGADQRVSGSDPSLVSLDRGEMARLSRAPALCEWVADWSAFKARGLGEREALDWLAEQAFEGLRVRGDRPGSARLRGRWSDRLLNRVAGGVCEEQEAWRALMAGRERVELGEHTRWAGEERRSKERGSL